MDIFDDRKLLAYETYEDYLDSFVQTDDIFYLRNRDFARINAALGYRLVYSYLSNKRITKALTHCYNVRSVI